MVQGAVYASKLFTFLFLAHSYAQLWQPQLGQEFLKLTTQQYSRKGFWLRISGVANAKRVTFPPGNRWHVLKVEFNFDLSRFFKDVGHTSRGLESQC